MSRPAAVHGELAACAKLVVAAGCLVALAACRGHDPGASASPVKEFLDEYLLPETQALVRVQTFRSETQDEASVVGRLESVRDYLVARAEEFNRGQTSLKLRLFEWKQRGDPAAGEKGEYWLFGFRLGDGPRKIALVSHLDTVPPGSADWRPFEPRIERRSYLGNDDAPFLVGRGTIDDKGPAIVAFSVLRALARRLDGTDALRDVTLEVAFDTSEETDMAYPRYIQDPKEVHPALGVIFDAMWCIRAEKGIERPVFRAPLEQPPATGLWVERLDTSAGSANQIPDGATAVVRGSGDPATLAAFAATVEHRYASHPFDGPGYRRAPMQATYDSAGARLVLKTRVQGAQHGSAPDENRESGANPLVSLANFLGDLVAAGELSGYGAGRMARFMAWGWGTRVFGERHPDLLMRSDEVFEPGNGTTYALTRFVTDEARREVRLEIDVRYALGHQVPPWDGRTYGLLPGASAFRSAFGELVARFQAASPGAQIAVATTNAVAPDVRDPESPALRKVRSAFRQSMQRECPLVATGGGTDAKGNLSLVAAGSLFTKRLGPPVNFHGIDEGAPIEDLERSAEILYRLLMNEAAGP